MTQMLSLYEITDITTLPHGALFISVEPKTNAVYAYFGETWIIGNDVYSNAKRESVYLGESFTPVDKTIAIALPLTLSNITDTPPPSWANYLTVSGNGIVRFWEYKPTSAVNSDDFDDYFYDFEVKNIDAGLTKLPYFYAVCYDLNNLLG